VLINPVDIAARAVDALLLEVATWPKPGLVSHVDHGSHRDMDAALLERSARSLAPYFEQLAIAGGRRADLRALRCIGLAAESAMMQVTAGVNTHRGAIFGLGLLCAAAGMADGSSLDEELGGIVRRHWGAQIGTPDAHLRTHGAQVFHRYGTGGARREAASGFPMLYQIGWPALRVGRALAAGDEEAARVHVLFALMASLEDTNLLHRGGPEGLLFARALAADFIDAGGVAQRDWRQQALRAHRLMVARRLSPGGSADLLAMTLFVDGACNPHARRPLDAREPAPA
jgi:triphosphoribosyl-dephospho-CoA synthase